MGNSIDDKISIVARKIAKAGKNIVFTGAGISTESGIPDFRSKGVKWTPLSRQNFRKLRYKIDIMSKSIYVNFELPKYLVFFIWSNRIYGVTLIVKTKIIRC